MPVELNPETPSQVIINAAHPSVDVTDKRGRKITVSKLGALAKLRLAELVGAENVKNEVYYGTASLAYHVTAIDGDPVPRPQKKSELEFLVGRLDDDGLDAIGAAVVENFLPKEEKPDLKN